MSMQILRAPEVMDKCGFKRTTLWRLVHESDFPKPIFITSKAIGWREDQIDEWIRSRPVAVGNGS